ncbi:ApeA N-terminal domain 1-containing protein [Gorillibacterium timonense]|uniref:ApeA N-terminal domain 1-containing protein n=1 Tax=Gorillibacterium timonense TaxID=1689269 RepID=UPI00071D290E|nr:HEPN domain-containing protein [Gorillibacterium timonense]
MDFINILNKFGDFWLVGKETQGFTGKLVDQDGSIALECYIEWTLIGNTDEIAPQMINGNVDGQKVTLLSAYCKTRSSGMLSTKCSALFSPNEVIIGAHYSNENFYVMKMEAHYTDLENWFMSCVFKPTYGQNSIIVELVKPEEVSISDKLCRIKFNFGMLQNYKTVKKLELTNQITVEFLFHNPTTLLDARSKVYSLRNLLLYFSGENLDCYGINFTNEYNAECRYHLNFQKKVKRDRELPYPITYTDIKDCFQKIWTAWTTFVENHEPLNNLFFEVISNHSRWSNQFLNLMQALETYSCRNREIEARKVFIEYHTKNPKNEKSLALKHRIVDILGYTNGVFLLEPDEIDTLATRASDTRNYYTHYSKAKEKRAFSIQDFGKVNRFFQAVIIAVVLKSIGVPESCIIQAQRKLFFGTVLSGITPYLK